MKIRAVRVAHADLLSRHVAKVQQLWERYWTTPDDDTLRIYADALEQAGDPRGRYIQLKLANKRDEAGVWERKHGGALVGDARTFLREWRFAANGTVERVRTEVSNLVKGLGPISRIGPRVTLELTSIKTIRDAKAIGALDAASVGRIHLVRIVPDVTDAQLVAMAPAFSRVHHLDLSCGGKANACFSPVGLHVLGEQATAVRSLRVRFQHHGKRPAAEYASSIAATFPALEVLQFPDVTARDLGKRRLKLV